MNTQPLCKDELQDPLLPNTPLPELPVISSRSRSGCSGGCDRGEPCGRKNICNSKPVNADANLIEAPAQVLSTLQADGSRRWLKPRLANGDLWRIRRRVAYLLMCVFVVLPHLRISGKPIVLLDIVAREFTLFGKTFLPTDTVLLALLALSGFVSIVLITALAGRAWCGWACPQTVYLEFLFRPIDRLMDGTRGKGGKPRKVPTTPRRVLRVVLYVMLCMFLAHTFLAYFVGTDRLAQWMRMAPLEHPTAFLVMAATTGLMLFDFLFFREQLCTLACPYGRLQSVMLDRQSLIVAYDHRRGDPRKKGKRQPGESAGDCVDCNQCVVVCPTGIDIREGLQMECINCTQCIDACNRVMDRIGSRRGLIRYGSQDTMEGNERHLLRGRTIAYSIILIVMATSLAVALVKKSSLEVRVIRGKGAPFSVDSDGFVTNSFSIRLVNRTLDNQIYELSIADSDDVKVDVIDTDRLRLSKNQSTLVPVSVRFPVWLTAETGNRKLMLVARDSAGNEKSTNLRILGPRK